MLWEGNRQIQGYTKDFVFTTVYDAQSFEPVARVVQATTIGISQMSKSKNKVNNGDIFVLSDIKLQDEIISIDRKNRLAKVIFISKMTKLMIAIILSKDIFKEIPDNIDDVAFSDNIFYTGSQLLKSGDWKVIGNQPVTEDEKNLTLRMVGNSLYLLDEYLGVVPNNERKKYKKQLISGIGALYNKINQLY